MGLDLFDLQREASRYYLSNCPNEIELYLSNGKSMYLHIDDLTLKSLYNCFTNTSSGKVVIRNQYAQAIVFNGKARYSDGEVAKTQVVLRSSTILGFIHYGATVFSADYYAKVLLMIGSSAPLFNLSFKDYEILRSVFIPPDNDSKPTTYPVWHSKRIPPLSSSGHPMKARNQWLSSFVFKGTTTDFNGDLRLARLVALQDNVLGYINQNEHIE